MHLNVFAVIVMTTLTEWCCLCSIWLFVASFYVSYVLLYELLAVAVRLKRETAEACSLRLFPVISVFFVFVFSSSILFFVDVFLDLSVVL